MKQKPKYKTVNKSKKYVAGTQQLNYTPDYSNYYNAQNDVYNRRTRETAVNSTILNPIAGAVGKTNFTGVTGAVSNFIDSRSIKPDGKQDVGGAVASNAIKYGGTGASIGSNFGILGTAIGGGIGVLAGGIYGGINAKNLNNKIETGKRLDKSYNDYLSKGINQYDYNTQGDINAEIGQASGFAKKGKYKLKSSKNSTIELGLDLPNPNKRKSRYSDYRRKPTR